jgi:hypothetical protein
VLLTLVVALIAQCGRSALEVDEAAVAAGARIETVLHELGLKTALVAAESDRAAQVGDA